MRIIVFYWRAAFGPFGYRVVLCPSIVFRGAPLGRNPSFLLEAQKCRVNCTFIQAEYITYKILPTERCFRRDACLLRRPRKVFADLRNIFAVRKKSPQTCETFSPSEKSFRSRANLFRGPESFLFSGLSSVNNSVSRNSNFSQRAEGFNHS